MKTNVQSMNSTAPRSTGDAYLDLAITALSKVQWPLTTKEILGLARKEGFMPAHLHGATQHKTLNARISEHIRIYRDRAIIYRVAPATYYLRYLKDHPDTPLRFRDEYKGVLRFKQVRRENVLAVPKSALDELNISGYVEGTEKILQLDFGSMRFIDRRNTAELEGYKKVISYTLLVRGGAVLSYYRGAFTTVSGSLKGARSIGFGGHINESDFDLFGAGQEGFVQGAARELHEELGIKDILQGEISRPANLRLLGVINIDSTADARQSIALVSAYRPRYDATLSKQELSINGLEWLDPLLAGLSLEEFEPWSAVLIEAVRSGIINLAAIFRGINW